MYLEKLHYSFCEDPGPNFFTIKVKLEGLYAHASRLKSRSCLIVCIYIC